MSFINGMDKHFVAYQYGEYMQPTGKNIETSNFMKIHRTIQLFVHFPMSAIIQYKLFFKIYVMFILYSLMYLF